ncbi:reactive mitochondrial oxygen species modulator 1-domain-containing protein [Emericellopsis atlantica]|uniref:Reactive mitochondrial oxygen species modulator 1-domain-containing protein n=1 Tax=Emericellopsis atlantica TaxID=2614577 RepID=A0A9P7ZFX3_9HYPO|nr:reactive mitochondrial oxygen species modulator 1-domain-containing protein [Emericellopsis atlantica]KAG9251364.1 reactive mitochondrial oxygen species modulator 1-domain-containing protein [Emericellopsis atlantica]
MPPVANIHHGQAGPSTFDKLKMGAMMGGTVGCILGFMYGTINIFRYGAGTNGVMRTLGQYMAGSGATFGFFMGVGSVIRTDVADPEIREMYLQAQRRPIIWRSHQAWRRD